MRKSSMLSKKRYTCGRQRLQSAAGVGPGRCSRTAHIACARNERGSHRKLTHGGLERDGCCSAFNSLAAA